jgi:hypothetical protein
VKITEGVDCGLDESLGACPGGDVVAVGDRLATHRFDLVHDLLGWREVATRAIDARTEVVDDHVRAVAGEAEGVFATDPATRTRDNGYTTFT